ncbi:MAG TPA: alpha/beta hydrolase [Chloroflexota bacterium]|nr:alpha/beta hydrolase [Chloroflexota bacterium]
MALAQVEGRQVEYELQGSGESYADGESCADGEPCADGELVLLLAASWWPLDTWKLSGFPQLAGHYQVLAPNQRGSGASAGTPGPYSSESQAGDAVALLDALKLSQPAHVIGFAQGCGIALKMALRHPDRVRSLVVAAPSAGTPASAPPPSLREREHIARQGFRDFIRHHALNDDFAFSTANYALYPERAAELADALWDHQGSEEEFLKHAGARQGYNAIDDARRVPQPALVLCGEEDNVERGISTPVKAARALAEAFPNGRLHLIPGVRHMTFWEDPAAAWPPVLDFLARC